MKFLIIADPLEGLDAHYDTGLAILRESLARDHQVSWATPEDVVLSGVRVEVASLPIFACVRGSLPRPARRRQVQSLGEFDAVWVRKDPPVNLKYISLCWLLALEERDTVIFNRPSLLIRHHEKMIPYDALRAGFLRESEVVPTQLLTKPSSRLPTGNGAREWITKPWLGHGGRDIIKWSSLDDFRKSDRSPGGSEDPYSMLQPFYPEVREGGDRRIIIFGGQYVGDFVRMPAADSIEANLARGGSAVSRPLTPSERDTIDRLGEYMKEIGIVFAGADMIGGRITEVNITAPTGLENFRDLGGDNLGEKLIRLAESIIENDGAWPSPALTRDIMERIS